MSRLGSASSPARCIFSPATGADRGCDILERVEGAPSNRSIDGVVDLQRRTWFDPTLVDALVGLEGDARFWRSLETPAVTEVEPTEHVMVADDARLDLVAHAFASIVDAKSPYTGRHSEGVAAIADELAAPLELDGGARATLRRAALSHDIGKLGVSNRILDKPGPLGQTGWDTVRRHPQWSMEILARISVFETVARIAGARGRRGAGDHAPGRESRPGRQCARCAGTGTPRALGSRYAEPPTERRSRRSRAGLPRACPGGDIPTDGARTSCSATRPVGL